MTWTDSGLLYVHREAQLCPTSLSSSMGALYRARPSHQGSQRSPMTAPKRPSLHRKRQGTRPGQALYDWIERMGGGGFRPRPPGVPSSRTLVMASEICSSPATASGSGPVIGGRTGPSSVTLSCSTSCKGSNHEVAETCCDQQHTQMAHAIATPAIATPAAAQGPAR